MSNDLTQAIANTEWTAQTPRLARRDHRAGWLTGYVSARLRPSGEVSGYQWWIEAHGRLATASDPDTTLTAAEAVVDADYALGAIAQATASGWPI